MESVIWGIEDEMEYESFQKTQLRLEERGIPEYDEANFVYTRTNLHLDQLYDPITDTY